MINTSLRRALTALLVSAFAATMVVVAAPAQATADFDFDRIFGNDRYATAAQIALDAFPNGASAAVIATGENFPDALAGSFLAGRDTGFPILLVQKDSVPAATSQALEELGVEAIALLGGPGAISAGVQSALDADYEVFRIQGQDRFDTARMIAETAAPADIGTVDGKSTAIIASGFGFADALAAGPLSYAERLPILLTGPQGLASPARSALEGLNIDHVIIVGGPVVISDTVKSEIEQLGIETTRIFGVDRFHTATEIADFALAEFGFDDTHVNLAKGIDPADSQQGFADALAGAPHAGEEQSVVLLTASDQLSSATRIWFEDHSDTLDSGHIFGGTSAVSDNTAAQAVAAARNLPGEVVRTDKDNNRYTYVPSGSDDAPTIDYSTDDEFFINGTPATIGAFENEINPGDQIKFTATDTGGRHELTPVATITGRTIGNIDTSDETLPGSGDGDNEFSYINDVTGDALRNDVKYDNGTSYLVDGTAVADVDAFEDHLNEGDVLTVSGGEFRLTNRTIAGEINSIERSENTQGDVTAVRFKIGPYGDDHASGVDPLSDTEPSENGNDTHYAVSSCTASGNEVCTVDGSTVTSLSSFEDQVTPGDVISYSRVDGTETIALTNKEPSTITGTLDSIDPDGNGDGGVLDDDEDGGSMTIDLPDGTSQTVDYGADGTFVVNGFFSTEAEFEAAADAGDAIEFRPEDTSTNTTQYAEVTDAG